MAQTVKILFDTSTTEAAVILLINYMHGNFEHSTAIALYQKLGNDSAIGKSFKMSINHMFNENERTKIVSSAAINWVNAFRMQDAEKEAVFHGLIFQRLFEKEMSAYEITVDSSGLVKLFSLANQYRNLFVKTQSIAYKRQFSEDIQKLLYDLVEYQSYLEVKQLD